VDYLKNSGMQAAILRRKNVARKRVFIVPSRVATLEMQNPSHFRQKAAVQAQISLCVGQTGQCDWKAGR